MVDRQPSGGAKDQLEALHRFFLWRYHEAVQRGYPIAHSVFPLSGSSRLDLVHVPSTGRVHFLYGPGDGKAHRTFLHSLSVEVGTGSLEKEKSLVARHFQFRQILVHFALEPPFADQFDRVDEQAMQAVALHARRPIRGDE